MLPPSRGGQGGGLGGWREGGGGEEGNGGGFLLWFEMCFFLVLAIWSTCGSPWRRERPGQSIWVDLGERGDGGGGKEGRKGWSSVGCGRGGMGEGVRGFGFGNRYGRTFFVYCYVSGYPMTPPPLCFV